MIDKKVYLINSFAFVIMTIYAVIRYNIAQDIGFERFFFFVINKSIAYTALFSIAMSALLPNIKSIGIELKSNFINEKKNFGLFGFYLALIHILITIRNINPENYPKFFDELGNFSTNGTLAIVFGILTISILLLLKIISQKEIQEKIQHSKLKLYLKTVYISLFFILLHNYFIGGDAWFTIEKWVWFMPPITLISGITVLIAFCVKAKSIFINKRF